jgi:hypothetical protein
MNCKIESQDKERSGILKKLKNFYLEKYFKYLKNRLIKSVFFGLQEEVNKILKNMRKIAKNVLHCCFEYDKIQVCKINIQRATIWKHIDAKPQS